MTAPARKCTCVLRVILHSHPPMVLLLPLRYTHRNSICNWKDQCRTKSSHDHHGQRKIQQDVFFLSAKPGVPVRTGFSRSLILCGLLHGESTGHHHGAPRPLCQLLWAPKAIPCAAKPLNATNPDIAGHAHLSVLNECNQNKQAFDSEIISNFLFCFWVKTESVLLCHWFIWHIYIFFKNGNSARVILIL